MYRYVIILTATALFDVSGWFIRQQELVAFADESVKLMAQHKPNYPGTHYSPAQIATCNGQTRTGVTKTRHATGQATFRQTTALQ